MKQSYFKFLLIIISVFLGVEVLYSQTTEDFETETIGTTSFTDNGQNFTIANGSGETTYDIEFAGSAGWNGSSADNQFIDNSSGTPTQSDGSSFTVTTTDGTDIDVKSLYLFISTRALANPTTTLTITGRVDGGTVYTITKNSGFSNVQTLTPNNGFTFIDFSVEGGADNSNTGVDEIIIATTNNADYIALDAFRWDIAPVCTEPDVPTVTFTPATICDGDNATLTISGNLNDATQWAIYTGSCGGSQIGTTATSTFVVTPTAPSTTYFVRGEGGCITPSSCGTVTVNVTPNEDASFTYSAAAYCVNNADPTPTITGLAGGTFSSGAGLSLNASSGQIDLSASTPGTYTVTYTTSGTCSNSSNVSVTINASDDASFSYSASTYCVSDSDPTPTITGLAGGAFSSGAGLSLNASSGQIDLSASTPGTYTVTYTTSGTCPNSSNVSVTINASDDASFSYSASSYETVDADPTPTITGLSGGTFTASPAGLSINSGTGTIDVSASTPNTYTVTYTTAGTCPNSSNASVAIVDPAPTVTSVSVPANATYVAGQNLDFNVVFDENVNVNTTGGTPQLAITLGSTIRQAVYIIGSGNTLLGFRYVVQAGDIDTDGITVGTLDANGGSIQDTAGNNADLTLNNVGDTSNVLVNGTPSVITNVAVPTNGTYGTGQNLDFNITFDKAVNVNTTGGTPQLAITVGSTVRQAVYVIGSGSTSIAFRYTIQVGDEDADGITVGTLDTNGGSIQGAGGSDADLTLNNVGNTSNVFVDAIAPTVTITSTESPGPTGANPIPVTVTFSESVTGFEIGDLIVSNGIPGNFLGSGDTYTADITPSGAGPLTITVDINADVALDGGGNGNIAATQFSIDYENLLNINDEELASGLTIYPVPSSNTINISGATSLAIQRAHIFDIHGKLIISQKLNSSSILNAIDITSIRSGLYLMTIYSETESTTKRVIKQ
ncbi:T9SS type A sorting domain-containing protein [Aquimarina sp. M1]